MNKKLYVLINKSLSTQQQAVQAGHAIAEFCHRYPDSEWNRGTLVYLGVADEAELNAWLMHFSDMKDLELAIYREEYYNQALTAIAVLGTPLVRLDVAKLKLI